LIKFVNCSIGNSKIFGNFLECKHSPILKDSKLEFWEEVLDFVKDIAKENSCFMLRFSPLYRENNALLEKHLYIMLML